MYHKQRLKTYFLVFGIHSVLYVGLAYELENVRKCFELFLEEGHPRTSQIVWR